MTTTHSITVPPDSTGKKVRHERLTDVEVTTELNRPQTGSPIIGKTSGATGVFKADIRAGSIIYYIHLTVGQFETGEILWDGATDFATVVETSGEIYTATMHVTDPDQPQFIQKVDKAGAAYATFPEGTPQFDAFGRMQVSQMVSVGEYYHIGEDQPGKYWTEEDGSGTVTFEANTSMIVYQTGTEQGARAARTTNQYHPYKIGTSQLAYFSLAVGDTGKVNVQRAWGYYDNLNGVFFRLNGTELEVVLRSDVTGSVVETVIKQADWNVNTMNNNVSSDFLLDVSKANLFWIDLSWLGVGGVRMGVVTPDRRRVTLHEFQNANAHATTYMRTANLPLRWMQENTGAAASTSEMRISCGVVFTESADVQYPGVLLHTSPVDPIKFTDSELYKPFLSFRPKLTINGKPNRIIGFHETFDWASIGNATLHVCIFVKSPGFLTDAVWSSSIVPGTMLEVDVSSSLVTIPKTDKPIESFIVGPNSADRILLGDRIEKSFGLPADGVSQGEFVFAARVLKESDDAGSPSASLFYTKYWKEVR
ncbi:MAG: hypothetical protein HRT93_02960 [Piscirickettsiaceae bacterium]|nr:hypothetical protein [Piscirickettsiaceae bacterium]